MSQDVREVNFDGLVGPTHNYAGLAHGKGKGPAVRALRKLDVTGLDPG